MQRTLRLSEEGFKRQICAALEALLKRGDLPCVQVASEYQLPSQYIIFVSMSSVLKNPEETHIFAILYPAPGKMQRVSPV